METIRTTTEAGDDWIRSRPGYADEAKIHDELAKKYGRPGADRSVARVIVKGGPGSGHFGHAGRPGKVGGSLPGTGIGATMSIHAGKYSHIRQMLRSKGVPRRVVQALEESGEIAWLEGKDKLVESDVEEWKTGNYAERDLAMWLGGDKAVAALNKIPQPTIHKRLIDRVDFEGIITSMDSSTTFTSAEQQNAKGAFESFVAVTDDGTKVLIKPEPPQYKAAGFGRVSGREFVNAEVMAYQVSEELGLDIVAPVIEVEVNGQAASSQYWVDGMAPPGHDSSKLAKMDVGLGKKMAVLDGVIGNSDRHAYNFLLDEDTGEIVAIDHGLSNKPTMGSYFGFYHALNHIAENNDYAKARIDIEDLEPVVSLWNDKTRLNRLADGYTTGLPTNIGKELRDGFIARVQTVAIMSDTMALNGWHLQAKRDSYGGTDLVWADEKNVKMADFGMWEDDLRERMFTSNPEDASWDD